MSALTGGGCHAPETSGLAIAAFVLALLPGTWPVGLVLAIIALRQIRANPSRLSGRALASWAIGIGAILTVLAGLALPVVLRATHKSRSFTCLSALKHLSVALFMYSEDFDDHLPPARGWCDAIGPRLDTDQLFMCPDHETREKCSYTFSVAVSSADLSRLPHKDQTWVLWDGAGGWNVYGGFDSVEYRHRGGAYFAYADGHCKWLAKKDAEKRWAGEVP